MKKFLKITLWVFVGFIILILGLYLFIQTETFNKWALKYTLSELNESWKVKDNNIEAESINGNILKGLKLNNGTITVKKDTILNFKYLDIKYDLWGLLDDEIRLDHVILNSPRINITKIKSDKDSLIWNFANLFSSEDEEDTSTSEFDMGVTIERLKIENGFFRIVGNLDTVPVWRLQRQKLDTFDFNNLDISNFELEFGARYFKDYKNLSLKNLSFNTNSDFSIKKLNLDFNVNIKDTITDLWAFELITNASHAKLNKISMNKFSPFQDIVYEEFKDKDFEADINIEKFNFDDLKFFLPSLYMMDSIVSLNLKAKGKYGDLDFSNLTLGLPNSIVNLKGKVKNLQDPSNLYLDVVSKDLRLNGGDLQLVYNDPAIPDYSYLGTLFGNLKYTGTLDNFYSEFDLTTDAGYTEGSINLNLDHETYNGNITTRQFNLGKILKDNSLKSNLNLTAGFSGRGFSLNNMSSEISYYITDSRFAGYDIRKSLGNIKADRNNLSLNISHVSSMGNVALSGRVNIANMNNPVYALKGKVSNLDVSKLTKQSTDKSNLNFSFNINGRGSNINNINGKYNFNVRNSFYANYDIPATPINIEINNSGNQSKISVVSDLLDFNASGTFNIEAITKVIQSNIASITNSLQNKLNFDSVNYAASSITSNNTSDQFDLEYKLVVKDTAKLDQVLNPFGMKFNGYISGNMSNNQSVFSSKLLMSIKDFVYNDTAIILKNIDTDFLFENNYSSEENSLAPYTIALNTTADKTVFGNNIYDSLILDIDMNDAHADFFIKGKQDTAMSGVINGNINMNEEKIVTNIDTLLIKYNQYEIKNNNNWIINYLPEGIINLEQLSLKSKNFIADVTGNYALAGPSDVKVEAKSFNPTHIFEILNSTDTSNVKQNVSYPVSGDMNLLIHYKGDFENPALSARLNSNDLKYNGIAIGELGALVEYQDQTASADIFLKNEDKGELKITGELPFENPLFEKDSIEVPADFSASPVTLKLTAKDFQIKYFSKLIPGIGDLEGLMNGEINTAGTVSTPELTGKLDLTSGRYYFGLTGMNYNYSLSMNTENSKLKIDKLSIFNTGNTARHLDLFGDIDFKGMKINEINLSTSGDMVLLDENAEENEIGLEGYLLAGIGNPPITIKGNMDTITIAGQFLIKNAKISSLPTGSSGYDAETDNFTYVSVLPDTNLSLKQDSILTIEEEDYNKINPFEKYKYTIVTDSGSQNIMNLDLNVKTARNIFVSIDFNNITSDRLFGEISADLNLKTVDNEYQATGSVNVVGDSYYRFYRNFKISNSNITFDGPLGDPILDIQAIYEGTKTTEQFGTISNYPVEVKLTVKGNVDEPKIAIKLYEDGSQVEGNDAEADAITYLLFGRYKSELTGSERKTMASSIGTTLGSLYISSIISQTVREVLPFIVDAEFNYSEGQAKDTDVEITSEFGDATVKVGGKLLKEVNNFEFSFEYPVNKLLKLNLPETLILEISREENNNTPFSNTQSSFNTGMKILYKFKY